MSDGNETQYGLPDEDLLVMKLYLLDSSIEGAFYGFYLLLALLALYNLIPWNGPRSISRSKVILLFSTLIMLGSTTGIVMIRAALWIIQLPLFGFDPPDNSRVVARLFVSGWWLTRINCIIGDAIVVWRAWILWDRHLVARILLAFCMFCTFAGAISDGVFNTLGMYDEDAYTWAESPGLKTGVLLSVPLLTTNICATSLVGMRAWKYRKSIARNLGNEDRKTQAESVLLVLVETGVFYIFVWIIIMIDDMAVIPVLAGPVLVAMQNLIVPMYPTIVILLSTLDRAPAETRFGTRGIGGSMKFAPPPPTFSHAMPEPRSRLYDRTTSSQLYSSGVRVPMDTLDSTLRHSRESYQCGLESDSGIAAVGSDGVKDVTSDRQELSERSSSRFQEIIP